MLGEIAARYGRHGISLASVHQDETSENTPHGSARDPADESASDPPSPPNGLAVPVVVVTHHAAEDNLLRAVSEINAMQRVHGNCAVISIIDEPTEQLITH